MPFTKPQTIPYPKVWYRFEITKNGERIKMMVQDLTDNMFDQSVGLLKKHFTADEPPCKHIEINKHPKALAELENLWRKTLKDKLSLICVLDDGKDTPTVVGLNVLTVACKDDPDEPFQTDDKIWAQLFGAVDLVARGVDIFTYYNVDKYLTAYGLIVVPEYRGFNIGKEILLARIPLCKSLGIPLTATVFTAAASQAVAEKAGFKTIFEMDYSELAKRGFVFPGIEASTKTSKLMSLVVN